MGAKFWRVSIECDKPMAEKKGFLPCNKKCESCICAIERFDNGTAAHVSLTKNE